MEGFRRSRGHWWLREEIGFACGIHQSCGKFWHKSLNVFAYIHSTQTSPPRSHTSMSRYSQSPVVDSPRFTPGNRNNLYAERHRSPPAHPEQASPLRRSESLDLHGLIEDQPDQSPRSQSIRRSITLHGRNQDTASPLRRRLGLGSIGPGRPSSLHESGSPESPVDLQRAESRRRRAALLNEMTSTPIRPTSRLHAVTDRPESRMSVLNGSGIRPSTSMSSFRAADTTHERRYRRDSVVSTRPLSVANDMNGWPASPVPRSRQPPSRLERRSTGRASPTKSVVSSAVAPVGTPSRVVMNRLLAALRQSSGQDTQEMLHACIALQETMAEKADEADVDFKKSCQMVAIDANQINANLKAALDIVNLLTVECESSSPEEAQIAAISATQKLADLIASSSKASDEKIKSLQTMFARLPDYTNTWTPSPASHALPSVKEDIGQSPSEQDSGTKVKDVALEVPELPEGTASMLVSILFLSRIRLSKGQMATACSQTGVPANCRHPNRRAKRFPSRMLNAPFQKPPSRNLPLHLLYWHRKPSMHVSQLHPRFPLPRQATAYLALLQPAPERHPRPVSVSPCRRAAASRLRDHPFLLH